MQPERLPDAVGILICTTCVKMPCLAIFHASVLVFRALSFGITPREQFLIARTNLPQCRAPVLFDFR